MSKMLQKYGNSHALIIDKAILEAAGITPETPLQVIPHNGIITIKAENVGLGPEAVNAAMDRIEQEFGEALTRLSK